MTMILKPDGLAVMNALTDIGWVVLSSGSSWSIPDSVKVYGVSYPLAIADSSGDKAAGGYPDEAPQGWEGKCRLVVQVGDWFYLKEGTVDSYYETKWDGKFYEVVPREKKVVHYEFEEA